MHKPKWFGWFGVWLDHSHIGGIFTPFGCPFVSYVNGGVSCAYIYYHVLAKLHRIFTNIWRCHTWSIMRVLNGTNMCYHNCRKIGGGALNQQKQNRGRFCPRLCCRCECEPGLSRGDLVLEATSQFSVWLFLKHIPNHMGVDQNKDNCVAPP